MLPVYEYIMTHLKEIISQDIVVGLAHISFFIHHCRKFSQVALK